MPDNPLRRALLLLPLTLATLAGCGDTDPTAPKFGSTAPQFAQGDNGTWTVTSLADPGDGICEDTDCTLREAMSAATSGGRIEFLPGLSGTILLANSQALTSLGKTLTIDGGGRITIDAQQNSPVMQFGIVTSANITLLGLTLVNGTTGIVAGSAVLTLDNVSVADNQSTSDGGGIALSLSTATIRNSRISGNTTSERGGGIHVSLGSSLTLINSTVEGNEAVENGGGIFSSGSLVITGSTISGNQAFNGGGMALAGGSTTTMTRSTISGNLAASVGAPFGGGIVSGGTLNLVSTTISANNEAGLTVGGPTSARNTLIAGNSVACDNLGGVMTSLGNNLSDFNAACDFDHASDVAVPSGQAFQLVLEADLKDNGGPTMTHALLARGLAIDAGYCPAETADQRGFTRPVNDPVMPDANDACDIGAYEAQGPLVAVADLMVSQTVDKNSVKQGERLTYTVRVQNLGPQTAPNVVLNNVLSSGVTFVEARQNKGSVTAPPRGETGTVTWYLGDMADQANEFAEIVVTVLVKGRTTITNTASVAGDVADPNEANNTAAITVSVAAGKSGGKKG